MIQEKTFTFGQVHARMTCNRVSKEIGYSVYTMFMRLQKCYLEAIECANSYTIRCSYNTGTIEIDPMVLGALKHAFLLYNDYDGYAEKYVDISANGGIIQLTITLGDV